MIDKLKRYAELKAQADAIRQEMAGIEADLQTAVTETGSQLAGYGWCAYLKPGRKSIDHEAAVQAKIEEYDEHGMHSLAHGLDELIEQMSTTKVTVKWAEVTKRAAINTEPFTKEGEPVFVVEPVK
jgi:hypothetical protein